MNKERKTDDTRRSFLRKSIGAAGGLGLALSLPVLNGCEETIIKTGPPDLVVSGDELNIDTSPGTSYNALSEPGALVGANVEFRGETLKLMVYRISETEANTMTRVCTHKQCDLGTGQFGFGELVDQDSVKCGCHASQFNLATGAVERGPAETDLQTYPTTIDGNSIIIKLA